MITFRKGAFAEGVAPQVYPVTAGGRQATAFRLWARVEAERLVELL